MAVLAHLLEPEDATYVSGSWTISEEGKWNGATYGKTRGGLFSDNSIANTYLVTTFPASKTTCCISGKFEWYYNGEPVFFGFASGSNKMLGLSVYKSGSSYYLRMHKWNTGTPGWDLLGTSSVITANNMRIEMMIEGHGETARVRVWVRTWSSSGILDYTSPHSLVLDDTYDTRVTGYTLDGVWCTQMCSSQERCGQVIAADEATHRYEIFPKAITGAGDANAMVSGDYSDIDEVNADTTDYVEADTDGQRILCAGGTLPTNAIQVKSVQLSGMMTAGGSGPTGALLGVKTNSSEDWADTTHELGVGWENHSRLMTVNPVTGNPWTVSEVNAMQYGVKGKDVP